MLTAPLQCDPPQAQRAMPTHCFGVVGILDHMPGHCPATFHVYHFSASVQAK